MPEQSLTAIRQPRFQEVTRAVTSAVWQAAYFIRVKLRIAISQALLVENTT